MAHKVSFYRILDYLIFGWIIHLAYPQYFRPKYGYFTYSKLFFHFVIPQKLLRINGTVTWPVHFTSSINHPMQISKGISCDPGDSPGVTIDAKNGILFGSMVGIGPGTIIENNDTLALRPMRIGNHVWIGANCVVSGGIEIGNNVTIGAGSIVNTSIPSNSIAIGNPCKVIKSKKEPKSNLNSIQFNRTIPKQYAYLFKK